MNPQIVAWFLGSVIVGIEKLRNQDTTLYRITVIVHAFLYPPFIVQLLIMIDFFAGKLVLLPGGLPDTWAEGIPAVLP